VVEAVSWLGASAFVKLKIIIRVRLEGFNCNSGIIVFI
jgi:hypothetical protein